MKAIFTYPNNSGTSFIDPTYIGDDTVGFQKRIKDLVDGNYIAWTGTIPSDTVTNIMSELSKYNNATWLEEITGNNSIYAFWNNPLYTGTVELISENISSATATHTVTSNIEFSGDHGLYDSQLMTLSSFDGSWSALNGNSYYVKKIDADTIQLCTDSALTLPIEFYDVKNATLSDVDINEGNNVDLNINTALHNDLANGTEVTLSNLDGTMSEHNGDNFYVQNLTANDFNLSYDSAGNNMLGYPAPAQNQPMASVTLQPWTDNNLGVGSGPAVVKLPHPSGQNLPFGSRVDFNPNDATTSGPQGQWPSGVYQGPSTMLSGAPITGQYLYLKPAGTFGSTHSLYELYYDALCTTPVESNIAQTPWAPAAPNSQAGNLTINTPVTLDRIGDAYTFGLEYSRDTSINDGDNIIQIINKDLTEQWLGFSSDGELSSNPNQAFCKDTNVGTGTLQHFNPYNDYALTTPCPLGLHILNAAKIVFTSDNSKVFLKGSLDDQGNLLTTKDVIINEDTIPVFGTINNSLHLVNELLQAKTFQNQTSDTNGILYPGFASVTGQTLSGAANLPLQTLDGKAIVKISSTATHNGNSSANTTIERNWSTSGYVERKTALKAVNSSSSWTFRTWEYNKTTNASEWSTLSGQFFTTLETMYNADPTTVIGRPFVFGWDYDASTGSDSGIEATGSVSSNKPKTAYMLPIGYKTYTDSVTGDTMAAFNIQSYLIDTTAANYGEIGANSLGYSTSATSPFSGFGMFGNYTTEPNEKIIKTYLQDTFESSRTPLTNEISFTITSGFVDQPFSTIPITSKLRTGDLVQVKTKNLTTGEIVDLGEYIANMHADYNNPDSNGNFIGNLQFFDTDGLGGWGNYDHTNDYLPGVTIGLPAPSSANNFHIIVETRYDSILSNTGTAWGGLYTPAVDNNVYMNNTLHKSLYVDGEIYSTQIGSQHTQVTTYDVDYNYVDSTQGNVQEVYTPPTANIIPTGQDIDATTGTLTIEANETHRYKLNSVSDHTYGNQKYLQRTGASTYVDNARLKSTSAWGAGDTTQQSIGQFPVTTVGTNGSGYLDGTFTFDTEFPGAFASDGGVAFEIETVPDTYTPPALSPAAAADVFDTDDQWADYGYANNLKEWPYHVTPSTATINYNSPTIVNNSQSGVKYTRSVGHTKWMLEVEYPPMTALDFQKFHAIAQAAQGQAMPFYFPLSDQYGGNILWRNFDQAGTPNLVRFKDAVSTGDRLALIEGFASNQSNAFLQGEVIVNGANENGFLHTVLNQVDSNVYGEAKIRTPWPFRSAASVGQILNKNPNRCVVTLNSDNFEYSVDTNGYYYVSVAFDLDNWK